MICHPQARGQLLPPVQLRQACMVKVSVNLICIQHIPQYWQASSLCLCCAWLYLSRILEIIPDNLNAHIIECCGHLLHVWMLQLAASTALTAGRAACGNKSAETEYGSHETECGSPSGFKGQNRWTKQMHINKQLLTSEIS